MENIEVSISMYPVGELGDCFLLNFSGKEGKSTVLIDSGSFRNSQKSIDRMRVIANDIKEQQTAGEQVKPLDLVVGTHQHNDHLSNFVHSKDIFKAIGMDKVWLSWLDDPKDQHATNIANGERKLKNKLTEISTKLAGISGLKEGQTAERINDILGFYGLDKQLDAQPPVIPQQGINNLQQIGKETSYLKPGQVLDLPGFPKGQVKVYVLGPPTDNNLLFDINPGKGESYEAKLAEAMNIADGFISALTNFTEEDTAADESFFPFNWQYKLPVAGSEFLARSYDLKGEEWRKIDEDWLGQAEQLALYLDSYTNNSSLVLAFELVEAQKVLLFVGDAQTGNWLSWKDVKWQQPNISLDHLLNNTVLYKVGHHCSHNATLPECLEKMTHPDLVAMIPVDVTDANITKVNGWKMPAANLYKRIKELTHGRVLRMDGQYEADCKPTGVRANSNWGSLLKNVEIKKNEEMNGEIITYKIS